MVMRIRGAFPAAGSERRSRIGLMLEMIALHHQIAVLQRNITRRPCFRSSDRLLWIFLSRWWLGWRESLMIVQPETVLRRRRNGLSAIWGYRSRGRWRGGRPRVSCEIRHLIAWIARENFLWGAPRIHGEILKLGFTVSQATVSRYMPAPGRRPTQSWRTYFHNQAIAFSHTRDPEEQSDSECRGLHVCSYWGKLVQFTVAQMSTVCTRLCRWLGYKLLRLNAQRTGLLSGQRDRGAMHRARRVAAVPGHSWNVQGNRRQTAVPLRSTPYEARASPWLWPQATQDVTLARSGAGFRYAVYDPLRPTRRTHQGHCEPSGRPSWLIHNG